MRPRHLVLIIVIITLLALVGCEAKTAPPLHVCLWMKPAQMTPTWTSLGLPAIFKEENYEPGRERPFYPLAVRRYRGR